MNPMITRTLSAGVIVAATAAVSASPTSAQEPPVVEHVQLEDTFASGFLTEACGVPVTITANGSVRTITHSNEGTGLMEVSTVSVTATATANGNTYRFRDAGGGLVRVEPDGTAVLVLFGQAPFFFTGVMKIDLETGEVIMESHHFNEDQLADACEVLTS